eukprot:282822-Chlamydomonas_euryale.AAC.1
MLPPPAVANCAVLDKVRKVLVGMKKAHDDGGAANERFKVWMWGGCRVGRCGECRGVGESLQGVPRPPCACIAFTAQAALSTLLKYIGNVVANPSEDKFRTIKMTNAAFQARVASVDGSVEVLKLAGFEEGPGGETLVMPAADAAAVELASGEVVPGCETLVVPQPLRCGMDGWAGGVWTVMGKFLGVAVEQRVRGHLWDDRLRGSYGVAGALGKRGEGGRLGEDGRLGAGSRRSTGVAKA